MSVWGVLAAVLALALPAGSALSLQCDTQSPAAMPCCAEGMADCGQPGMVQDCCMLAPAGGSDLVLSPPATLHEGSWHPWSLAPVPGLHAWVSLLPAAPEAQRSPERAGPLHAPPFSSRTTVLRI